MSENAQQDIITETGLTAEEVQEQIRKGRTNVLPDASAKSVADIIRENIFTYFNGIFLLLAILLVAAGSYKNLTFLPVIIFNTLIGIAQEINAKNVLDKLAVLHKAKVTVLRDGKEKEISTDRLVYGDVILLSSGCQIPADAVVVDGQVAVNESLLTGESDEIVKTSANGQNELMSGSFVVSGQCRARLVRVGANSYISKLTMKAKQMPKAQQSEMVHDIDLIVRIAGIAIIPIGIVLFYQGYAVQGNTFQASVTSMVAAVIGMIPEGLYLLVSVALAMSTMRLAQHEVVLHDMRSIETLARVDVLCVDKTGTITTDQMSVTDVVTAEGIPAENQGRYEQILAAYIREVPDTNSTMLALREAFTKTANFLAKEVLPFSSKNKYSEVRTASEVYRLGAPEFILPQTVLDENRDLIEYYEELGERVLVFAKGEDATGVFSPLLFISLKNDVRTNVEDTFAYFCRQGVDVKVISGDNPLTVSRIAGSVNIPDADYYVDASTLKTKEDMDDAVRHYTVFGRVRPEQKKELVQAFKRMGHTVAMTGDGVNDILAMKEADCSIAMGAGSDAAMQAAQVVLLDSDFGHMQEIVSEGRRNINNISRSATLFLVKNIFSLLLSVFSIINLIQYPLQPTQISLISMFNIGLPAFLLAFEPNIQRQKPHFLRRVLIKAMPAALTDFFVIAALVVFGLVFGVSNEDTSVASTFLLAIVGFIILVNITRPMNRYRLTVIIINVIGLVFAAYFLPDLFSLKTISLKAVLLFILFAIACEPFMRYLTKLAVYVEKKVDLKEKLPEA